MNAEPGTVAEDDGYYPDPVEVYDGGVVIFDRYEFEQKYNCDAAIVRDGCLFVLDKDSRRWVSAEAGDKPRRGLAPVK